MEKLRVELDERSYEILIDRGNLPLIGERLLRFSIGKKIAVISNPKVYELYGEKIISSLKKEGFDPSLILIPDGEIYKDYFWAYHILTQLLELGLDRKSCLIALGGGVIGDITGFVASIYMRGIPYIQIPTTLLSQVDSSVGGKTAVNHPLGKNMIGSFWQPSLVWIDVNTLDTLPEREFISGMAEIIKYGIIWDKEFFEYLESNREKILKKDKDLLIPAIKRACEIKAEVVSKDERESSLRAILNYGHTIGHAIETLTGYTTYLHGEAISIGMVYEAKLSNMLGFLDKESLERIKNILKNLGLPTILPINMDSTAMVKTILLDKKNIEGKIRMVIPESIGKMKINFEISEENLKRILNE
ncbi:MAG: 3-dehydroquinate synthase [Thermodesulfovibrio sp.]|uniref:3-dehydroquinate synthase n=1 Tax=unclassified Thermodesulfovibrio TaxID=2645936 RepID=UPI00083B91B8|nr:MULTISPECIES: 3-dehydroquinate synthase [unclassified Thermodesulfovibrio]MDI1471714.1 3-dehydroquinate synthase [Thermodesulfovibrio sp. 1176]MDI6713605.1 3-dehydroquinate synthase [Thermodesulfovibrio sp.]ODA44052.1 3-dehydroquinate synthase [Thermodesulfovibrio sp. N1]